MMIFPRLARDVERQRTYLDSQLISFQTSFFFAKHPPKHETSHDSTPRPLYLTAISPANIFQKYRFPPFFHIATIVSSVFVQDPLTLSNNYIFQLAVVHLVSRAIVGSSHNLAFYDFIAGELHIRARVTV